MFDAAVKLPSIGTRYCKQVDYENVKAVLQIKIKTYPFRAVNILRNAWFRLLKPL